MGGSGICAGHVVSVSTTVCWAKRLWQRASEWAWLCASKTSLTKNKTWSQDHGLPALFDTK